MSSRVLLAVALLCSVSYGQVSVSPLLQPHATFVDQVGAPCAGCALFSYTAGTTIATPTYRDAGGSIPNTNPIVLSVQGGADIWVNTTVAYKFVLKNTQGTTLWTVDNIKAAGAGSISNIPSGSQSITQPPGTDFGINTSGGGKFNYNGSEVVTFATGVVKNPTANQIVTQPAGSSLSANNLNNLLNVNLFSGSDTAGKTLAAQTACGAGTTGCFLNIPPGAPSGAIPATGSLGANTIIEDQRFVNSGGPFYGLFPGSHAFHEYTQSVGPLQSWETGANPYTGPSILALTAFVNADAGVPSPRTQGEVVPLYINVERNTGSNRFVEGADINIGVKTLTNDANALELDCNNQSGVDDTTHIHCLQIIGGDNNHPGSAVQITSHTGPSGYWNVGMDVGSYHTAGVSFDSNDTGALSDILIHPPNDDPAGNTILQFNNAKSQIVFNVRRNGDMFSHSVNTTTLNTDSAAGFNGVINNGSAWQTFTGSVGCTTAAIVGASCTSAPIPLSVPFASANYALVCTLDTTTGVPVVTSVSKATASFTVTIAALNAVAATAHYNCTAIMHP